MSKLPDGCVDLIVADPPYFINMGHAGSTTNLARSSAQLLTNRTFTDLNICAPFFKQLFAEIARVLTPEGAFYWFTDWRGYAFYFPLMAAALPVRNLIVWDKKSGPGSFYSFAHELVIFGTGRSKTRAGVGTNVWREPGFTSGARATDGDKVHPTQKPVNLIKKMIMDSTEPGSLVLDPFLGSGSTAVACIETGREFIGYELSPAYFETAQKRIAEAQART